MSYDPIVLSDPNQSSLVLTSLPSPETETGAIIPIVELAEKIGGGGNVFADPANGYDIGYGAQINASNLTYILQAMGVTGSQQIAAASTVVARVPTKGKQSAAGVVALQQALNQAIGQTFILSADQAAQLLQLMIQSYYIPTLNQLLAGDNALYLTTTVAGNTQQYLALLDMFYSGGSNLFGKGIAQALATGNRADAWFQIRYLSDSSLDPGQAKRRDWDAQMFGLFSNPSNPSQAEVLQAYQMLTHYRQTIIQYEAQLGVDPDPGAPASAHNEIPLANSSFHLSGTSVVQTLAQAFAPAETVLLSMIQNDSPLIRLLPANWAAATDIYLASSSDPRIDVSTGDSAEIVNPNFENADLAEAAANHVLIGTGNGQTLIGGLGNDVLFAGSGNETLVAGNLLDTIVAGAGTDTVIAKGIGDSIDFEVGTDTDYQETLIENASTGADTIYVDGEQIGGGMTLGPNGTWTDSHGLEYQFQSITAGTQIPLGFGSPVGFSPSSLGPYTGVLEVSGGALGDNELDIWGFNLQTSENSGFDGIQIPEAVVLSPGASVPNVLGAISTGNTGSLSLTAGQSAAFTAALLAPSDAAQTITFTLTGGDTSAFSLLYQGQEYEFNNGTVSISVAAGVSDIDAALNNTSSVGASETLQLTATASDPAVSAPLTINFTEPTPDPFNTNTTNVIAGQVENSGSTTYTAYTGDGADDLIAANSGVNYIVGGNGNDLITGGNGNGVIVAGSGDNHIYAGNQADLQTAINSESSASAGTGQGYFIGVGDGDNTIVGGSGNELVMVGDGNNLIVAGANDTVYSGVAVGGASLTWSTSTTGALSASNENLYINFPGVSQSAEGGSTPAGYEGVYEDVSAGLAVGTGNDTILGGSGNGEIWLSNGNNYVDAGAGNDEIIGGMGSNTIMGGTGNISVLGGGGSDYIDGGSGSSLLIGRGGDNTIIGGSGNDTLYAGNISLSAANTWSTSETGSNYVEGGSGNDQIFGAGGHDTLIGGSGNDSIYGGAGTEFLTGGSGKDLLTGGAGNDTLEAGGAGQDTLIATGSSGSTSVLYGGDGTDLLKGGLGTNILYAGDGGVAGAPTTVVAGTSSSSVNTLYGGVGVDVLDGGAGTDVIYAGDGGSAAAPTTVVAGSGATTVYGGSGTDSIQGGSGTDVLYAGDGGMDGAPTTVVAGTGADTLYGGAGVAILRDTAGGSDLLVGGSGDDSLFGSGSDTLVAGTGDDYLDGGSGSATYEIGVNFGSDLIVASAGTGLLKFDSGIEPSDLSVTATLSSDGTPALEIDDAGSLTIVGGLSGGITGISFADSGPMTLSQLVAAAGVDQTISGENGNLVFDVENGDSVTGGAGLDTIFAWGADDTLTGGQQADIIMAEGSADQIVGGDARDTVVAAGDNDIITAGANGDQISASGQSEQIFGGAGADTITASGENDTITAGNSADQISVTGAHASIIGGGGNDTLIAAGQADTIEGGTGGETFVIEDSSTVINAQSGFRDTIESSVSYVLSAFVGTLNLTGSGDLTATDAYGFATITGNAGHDTLIGGSRNDELVAGSGIDTLIGGSGYTLFDINNEADVIELGTGSGAVQSSVSYTLMQGLDTLTLTGTADLVGTGNGDAGNSITGNAGNDTLLAGSGRDTITAGTGTDTLVAGTGSDLLLGNNGDTFAFSSGFGDAEVSVSTGQGTLHFGAGITVSDLTVGVTHDLNGNPTLLIRDGNSSITVDGGLTGSIGQFDFADGHDYNLAELLTTANVQSATVTGATGNFVFNGTPAATLAGGTGQDTLIGLGSSDTLVAGSGNQELFGFGSDAVLVGSVGDDTLHGGIGDDTLIGGTGTTVMDGGQGNDFYMLTAGGTAIINPSDTAGTEVLYLPAGMSFSDFTAYESPDGDLILKTNSGDTAAVIKGFYLSTSPQKTWVLADDADLPEFLTYWLSSTNQIPSGSTYSEQIEQLRLGYAARLGTTLQELGAKGATIIEPTGTVSTGPYYNYVFNGVTTQNVTVEGGSLTLPASVDTQYSYTTNTSVTTQTIETPVYGTVSVPGHSLGFLPVSSNAGGTANGDTSSPFYFQPVYDSGGNLTGYNFTLPATTRVVQTGTVSTTETVDINTTTTTETQGLTVYNITGDGGNDVITASSPFAGTVVTGDGNVLVDLGAREGDGVEWTGSAPSSDMVGAFIECGSGNDTIWGTENSSSESITGGSWSADVIAAGSGFDYLYGSLGTTYYVPLDGYSTDVIADVGSPYVGVGGVYDPPTTVILPAGITPADLKYRVFQDPDSGSEVLQLQHGSSDVLVYDDDDPNSPTYFQFTNGTLLTRDQLIAQATLLPNDFNPVVTQGAQTVQSGQAVAASTLFTATDAPDAPITWYQFSNTGTDGGYFVLNGEAELPGQSFMVNAGQLAHLTYIAGPQGTTDAIQVSAFDGAVWSSAANFTVNSTSDALRATGPNQLVTGSQQGADTLVGGYGGDTLVGASRHDTFDYESGSGAETISEAAATNSSSANVLQFGAGISPSNITLTLVAGGALVATIGSSGDSVTIEGFDPTDPLNSMPVQQLQFADGTSLSFEQFLNQIAAGSGSVTGADGSVTYYDFTPGEDQIYSGQTYDANSQAGQSFLINADGTTRYYAYDTEGRTVTAEATFTDGSIADSTYNYNADGSYTQTELDADSVGGATTQTVTSYDSTGAATAQDVTNPDGSTWDYAYDSQGRTVTADATFADGSIADTTYNYNADGSYAQTELDAGSVGGPTTQTVTSYDSTGAATAQDVTNPDGSTWDYAYDSQGRTVTADATFADGSIADTTYNYNADGSYAQTELDAGSVGGPTTQTVTHYDSTGTVTAQDVTNPDGSTSDSTYSYNADGSFTDTRLNTPADGSPATTHVSNFDSNGNQLNENYYTPSADGSYTDSWQTQDGSNGSYWWNASMQEYQATWYDSNGARWTDDYQYAAGGSPGSSGVSFTETYTDSEGDQGTRQFNATTGITSLSWDSSATGTETGTTTDSGFIGLQNDGELTNTLSDPSFFNPTISPAFQSFLAGH